MPFSCPERNREYKRLQRAVLRARWKAEKLCALCGKVPQPEGGTRCRPCAIKQNRTAVVKKNDLKIETFSAYGGGFCHWRETDGTMCAIIDPDLLALDHINNDGGAERRASRDTSSGVGLYRSLKKAGFPAGYQVLCHNHNWKKNVLNLKRLREIRYGLH